MAAVISVMPIRPGRAEEWNALHAELMGTRRIEWAQSQRRRGITRQVISLVEEGDRLLAAIFTEASDPQRAMTELRSSLEPFDRWLVERLDDLLDAPMQTSTMVDTAPRPGPWRGWRR